MSSLIFTNIPESQWGSLEIEDLCLDDHRRLFFGTDEFGQAGLFVQLPNGTISPLSLNTVIDAEFSNYSPANSSDWDSPQPTTIAEALDQLAARLRAIE